MASEDEIDEAARKLMQSLGPLDKMFTAAWEEFHPVGNGSSKPKEPPPNPKAISKLLRRRP